MHWGRRWAIVVVGAVAGGPAEPKGVTMTLKKIIASAAIGGALGLTGLGLGAGPAQADDDWGPWVPWVPQVGDWVDDWTPWAPGQVQKLCPWHSPPGHWIGGPHGIPCT